MSENHYVVVDNGHLLFLLERDQSRDTDKVVLTLTSSDWDRAHSTFKAWSHNRQYQNRIRENIVMTEPVTDFAKAFVTELRCAVLGSVVDGRARCERCTNPVTTPVADVIITARREKCAGCEARVERVDGVTWNWVHSDNVGAMGQAMAELSKLHPMFDMRVYVDDGHELKARGLARALHAIADAIEEDPDPDASNLRGGFVSGVGGWNVLSFTRPDPVRWARDGLDAFRASLADRELLSYVDALATRCALLEDELRRRVADDDD